MVRRMYNPNYFRRTLQTERVPSISAMQSVFMSASERDAKEANCKLAELDAEVREIMARKHIRMVCKFLPIIRKYWARGMRARRVPDKVLHTAVKLRLV